MRSRSVRTLLVFLAFGAAAAYTAAAQPVSTEYTKHFEALTKLSIAVAQAMSAEKYDFKPHPESMTFGELMVHIATTDYQFCAGLKDTAPPAIPKASGKDAVVKLLTDSFSYCSGIIPNLTEAQLTQIHSSPDGRLPGREVLLAMYVH